jgi:hypothetical protein
MAETLFAGHLDLAEWKPGSERPTAVGNDKVTLRNRSRASHHAEHVGSALSDVRSTGRMTSSSQSELAAWGSAFSQGNSASVASTPPSPLLTTSIPLSQNAGSNSARSLTASGARSSARSVAQHSMHARGTTLVQARADGASIAEGEHEAFVTRYELLPSAMFSLEEQLHRATALLMNLPRRECVIKLESAAPYQTRTPDLTPAFKSEQFRKEILPRYIAATAGRSPYSLTPEEADAAIAARLNRLTEPASEPEPDFSAPVPMVSDPQRYARGFWQRRGASPQQSADEAKTPASAQSPAGDPADKHGRFQVIDGGKDGDNLP